jgi:isopenicillin N synthase-like dioxygenase
LKYQWPDPSIIGTDFREIVESYMVAMRGLYRKFLKRLEVELVLPKNTLLALDTSDAHHRLKLVKYFPKGNESDTQGVGAHQDETGWLTFVSEVDHPGLQVHLRAGSDWETVTLPKGLWALNIG